MAGLIIDIEYDDAQIQHLLDRLVAAADDLSVPFGDIGEYLGPEHAERWFHAVDSEWTPWEGLLTETWAKKKTDRMLVESGDMLDDWVYQASETELLFGPTDHVVRGYSLAAIHHFGVEENNLPAREILGINDVDEAEIMAILQNYLLEAAQS